MKVVLQFGPSPHTWAGDLEVTLIAPNGDDVHLFSRLGALTPTSFGDSSDLLGPYTFVDSGASSFASAAAAAGANQNIPAGTYNRSTAASPIISSGQDLDGFGVFQGDDAMGFWTLNITDWAEGDSGALASWSVTINYAIPAPPTACLLLLMGALGRRRGRV